MPFSLMSSLFQSYTNREAQYQHDRDMYNMQRKDYLADREYMEKYNSPSAQVQRLRDAGLNPTMAMSNIQTGQVNSPNSPNAQSSSAAIASGNLTQGVLGLLGAKSELKLKEAQAADVAADAKLKEIRAETESKENLARIDLLLNQGRESRFRGDHTDSLLTAQYQKLMSDIGVNASQSELNWSLHATKMKELKYLPIDKALSWIETIGGIMESASRREVNRQQALYLIEKATAERFGWKGRKFENELNEEARDYLLKALETNQYKGLGFMPFLLGRADSSEGFFK